VLAKHFNISAVEALNVRPAWELDNLLARHYRDLRAEHERVNRGD
jgi:hypothetical protein